MYWFKRFLLGGLLFFLSCPGFSQTPADTVTLPLDTIQQVATVDHFDYVFPPDDRPNKLLQQFLQTIQERSIDPIRTINYLEAISVDAGVEHGQLKNGRPTWVLLLVFVLFLAIAIVRLFFPGDFAMIVQAYFHERTLQQISKEDNMLTSWPYIFLYLIFSLALGLFIVLLESSFSQWDVLNWNNYLRTSVIVAVLFILKIIFIRFVSFLFEIDRLVREYVTVLYLVYFNSMLILMPFLLLLLFLPTSLFKSLLILFVVIVSMLFIYRFLRTALRLFGNLRFSVFYLILYLCALEVAPILILVKTLSN